MTAAPENTSLAREGIKLLLNNKFDEAKELFNADSEDIQMAAGFCFLTFMNALMTFEEGKLEESLQTLKDIEKRCSQDFGWLKSMKNKVLSTFNYPDQDLAEKLEKQIILADSHLCVALLTFLQQDLTSYVKGGWVLMKAWKVYQDTYMQILNLYKKTFTSEKSVPGSQFLPWEFVKKSASSVSLISMSSSVKELSVPNTPNGDTGELSSPTANMPSSASFSSGDVAIQPDVIARLMAAVSFGYGIFQLCISLLPSSFLKLIHFLGFEGGRDAGLSALMFSREGTDMRAPLATLTLLWYHTIVRPFFAVDGSNVQAGVDEAETLINESQDEFGESALFLFFKGRVQRLKSNIPGALKAYESAIDKSNQREIQLLCLHEVGWCYLIQLDWGNAFHCFNQLRTRSKWSQSFYTYLNMLCIGALGDIEKAVEMAEEIPGLLNEESAVPQIKIFISRRLKKYNLPKEQNVEVLIDQLSCELLLIELLYFWNALPSCDPSNLKNVMNDFQSMQNEKMPGLCSLIEGAVHLCTADHEKAIASFRKCLDQRKDIKSDPKSNPDDNDDHISAFASFELATILVQNSETLEEGKRLLLQAQNDYKGYDFEYRLTIRINSMLKKIN